MKKLITLLFTLVLISSLVAQTTAINESFESWPAPEWGIYMYEEGGWESSTLFGSDRGYGGGNCAEHRIENNATDDWLVSPQINIISSDYNLSFYEKSLSLEYYTGAWVYISAGSGDPADGDFVEISESLQIEDTWVEHVVDLSSYYGENIYIAFVFQGPQECWHHWLVDEVVVSPSTLIDGGLTEIVNPTGINPVPSTEDVIVTLHNYGTETINDADFEWSVNGASQTTYEATGLNLASGEETNITVGQYDFATQGDYLISVNVIIDDDFNPGNDLIEGMYYVTDPKNVALTDINPEGYLAVTGNRDVSVTIVNVGDYTVEDILVEWEVDGVLQTEYEETSVGLNPGEDITVTVGQYNFQNGLVEINATVVVSGDEDLSNNSNTSYVAVNILWESFEGEVFPPEMWEADDYPLRDYFYPHHGAHYYSAQTDDNMFGEISDTLYTPLLNIESGDVINFWVSNSAFFTNDDKLIWKDGTTGEIHLIGDIESELEHYDEVNMDISAASGINYIGFVNNNSGSYGMSNIDLITSTADVYHFNHDLGIRDFDFEYLAKVNEVHTFNLSLRNYGTSQVSGGSYSVKLMTETGELITEQAGITLESWEEGTVEMNHTFTETDVLKVYAIIDYTSDEFTSNNGSETRYVYPVPSNIQVNEIGFPEEENLMIPFNTGGDTWTLGSDDISQHLYYQDELPEGGYLYGITLYYHELFGVGQYLPIQVWLKEIELEDLSGGWIPIDEMQMVFNDTIEVYPGHNSVYIPFEEPVLITGANNLAIQYYQYEPEWPFTACRFYSTNNDGGPVRAISLNDAYELDPNDPPDYWGEHTDYNYTTFVYQPIGGEGIISGHVYDENDEPIHWAVVEIEGTGLVENTDENGYYEFPAIPYETYDVTVEYVGYYDNTQTVNLNAPDVTADFYMELVPLVSLYGEVFRSNAPDVPLEGVLVTIDGYDFMSTYTDEDGAFVFEEIYGNNDYAITFELYGYHTLADSVVIEDQNVDYGIVFLEEELISAYNVRAIGGADQAMIEWQNPATSQRTKLQNDTDGVSNSYTNEPYEEVWLGNRFENSDLITITSIEVLWDIYETVHDFVTIDIIDNQGNVMVSSQAFLTHNDSLMTIDVPNLSIESDFYAMVHWQDNPESTDPLTIDWTEDVPNTAYIMYPGEEPVLLSDFLGSPNASWFVRVNILEENSSRENRDAISYNIYRGLAENIYDAGEWIPLNVEPVMDLIFVDETWTNDDPQLYAYAVEAVYVQDSAELTFSNFIAGTTGVDETEMDDVNIYPNPASRTLNISGVKETTITVYNIIGEVMFQEQISTSTTQIDVSYLENGNYFVRVAGKQGQVVKKLIVAR